MVFQGTSGFRAQKMLVWLSSLDFDIERLNDIPSEYLVNFIILASLVKNFSLKMFEVEAIFRTIVDINKGRVAEHIKYPKTIDIKALRASFLYSKLYFIFHACLGSVGIKQYQVRYIV